MKLNRAHWAKLVSEAIGTFTLIFAGTGAIIVNDVSQGAVTHVGIALTFGLVVMSMIYALGDISGAHLNPVVTLTFWLLKRLPSTELPIYMLGQIVGGFMASVSLRWLFQQHATLGSTLPRGTIQQSFVLETILTAILIFVVLRVAIGAKEKGVTAAIAVGAVVGLEALFAGPICGASMNPIRSLAPAVVSGTLTSLWVYLTAPVLGGLVGIGLFKLCPSDLIQRDQVLS